MVKELCEGTLKPPEKKKDRKKKTASAEDTGSDGENDDDINKFVGAEDDHEAIEYHKFLTTAAVDCCMRWEVDDWVVVNYDNQIFPGQITVVENGGVYADCMHECFPGEKRNHFRWPNPRDNGTFYDATQILCTIKQPEKPTNSQGAVKLADDDFQTAHDLLTT